MAGAKQGETKAGDETAAARLAERLAAAAAAPGPAPVERWNPPRCGAIDIRIDRAGVWHHEGRPIRREALTRLFARVLRREADGGFVLVTPAEKLAIAVEDTPFVAVELIEDRGSEPAALFLVTNLGEVVRLDAAHPLRIDGEAGDAFVPYVTVRGGLEARLSQAAARELAGLAEIEDGMLGVRSAGRFFPIGTAEAAAGA